MTAGAVLVVGPLPEPHLKGALLRLTFSTPAFPSCIFGHFTKGEGRVYEFWFEVRLGGKKIRSLSFLVLTEFVCVYLRYSSTIATTPVAWGETFDPDRNAQVPRCRVVLPPPSRLKLFSYTRPDGPLAARATPNRKRRKEKKKNTM